MRVGKDEVSFNVFQSSKCPMENDTCLRIDSMHNCVADYIEKSNDPLNESQSIFKEVFM